MMIPSWLTQVTPKVLELGPNWLNKCVGTDVRIRNCGDVPMRWEAEVPKAPLQDGDNSGGSGPMRGGEPDDDALSVEAAGTAADNGRDEASAVLPTVALHPNHGALLPGEEANVLVLTSVGSRPGAFSMAVVLRGATHTRRFAESVDSQPSVSRLLRINGTAVAPEPEPHVEPEA